MVVRRQYSSVIMALFLLSMLPIGGAGEEVGYETSWIDASINLDFINGTHIQVTAVLDVHNITVYGKIFGADDIREIYDSEGGAFRAKVFDYVYDILANNVFKGCDVNLSIPPVADPTTLNIPSDSVPYNPPVTFIVYGNITLRGAFFNFGNENLDNLINGLLNVGAQISYDVSIFAPPGWNITYIMKVPDYLSITETNGHLSIDGKTVTWDLENWKSTISSKEGTHLGLMEDEPSCRPEEEIVTANISFDLRKMYYADINISLNFESLYLSDLLNLPEFISDISFYPADAVRLLCEYGIASWSDVGKQLEERWEGFSDNFRHSLGKNVSLAFSVDEKTTSNCVQPYNVSSMDGYPPISVKARGTITDLFDDFSVSTILGIIYSGGVVRITDNMINLDDLVYPFQARLILPYGEVCKWNRSVPLNVNLSYDLAPRYKNEDVERVVEITVKDMNIDFLKLFVGKKNIVSSIDIREHYYIHRIPSADLLSLPEWIDLEIVNADLFRLFVEDGVLNESALDNLFARVLNFSKETVHTLTGEGKLKIYINDKLFEDSLKWDRDIKTMDDEQPVDIPTFSSITKRSGFSISVFPPSLDIKDEKLNCVSSSIENITYRIIFPKGVSVVRYNSSGNVVKGKTVDGRECLEITIPRTDSASIIAIHYSLRFSPLMVLKLFMPPIIMAVIVISLIAIVLFMRRRRRYRLPQPQFRELKESEESGQQRE